jgi:hypothetical protein
MLGRTDYLKSGGVPRDPYRAGSMCAGSMCAGQPKTPYSTWRISPVEVFTRNALVSSSGGEVNRRDDDKGRCGNSSPPVADGHRFAFAHEFGEVQVERHRGHARQGNGPAGRGSALCERNDQRRRGPAAVVVEHFVEIAHAIEEQHVGVLGCAAQVLLPHGGVVGWRHRPSAAFSIISYSSDVICRTVLW